MRNCGKDCDSSMSGDAGSSDRKLIDGHARFRSSHLFSVPSPQVCYVWGVFALFFQSPTTVGLCVSSLSLAATLLLTHELRHRAHTRNRLLAEAVDYLHEGSKHYRSVLDQCKWIATKNQLLNDTTLYISTKKNKLVRSTGRGMPRTRTCTQRAGGPLVATLRLAFTVFFSLFFFFSNIVTLAFSGD